ncbi:MAG: formate dehydrogenase major subunit [Clostridia bacterium]|nr:formate dehydrogenase major subunit [Clostridia bacterium]
MAGLAIAFGSGAMTNSIAEIEHNDVLLIIGSNTTEAHPVIGQKMKQAARRGAKLIVVDPRRIELVDYACLWLPIRPGTNVALINALMYVIITEGLVDKEFIAERTEGYDNLWSVVQNYPPERVAGITGVPAEDIRAAARLYATTDRAGIFYTLGITEHTSGTNNVMNLANLAMITGHVGKEFSGVNPLRGQNNVQGACDMGALPDVFPGYQKVANPEVRERFAAAWNCRLDGTSGLRIPEMIDLAAEGYIRAMYIMGEDPALTDPDITHVRKALANLDFLVVQDLFISETAKFADVVLPGASFLEKDGTFTSTERRVQRVRQAISPRGESRPDWQIIGDLATRMGYPMEYNSPEQIFAEMAGLTPSYAGMSYERLAGDGLQWPCPAPDHPGTKFLHAGKFPRGKGLLQGIEYQPPAEVTDEEYPILLTTGRMLYHYGVTTRRSAALESYRPEEYAEINPAQAAELGVKTGDKVTVVSRRGRLVTRVQVTDRVPPGIMFMTYHYKESPVNILTNAAFDPVAKTAEYKVAAVRLEPAG